MKYYSTVLYDRELFVQEDADGIHWNTIWISTDNKTCSVTREVKQEITNRKEIMKSFYMQQLGFCFNMCS